jgi:hypothetical protein
VSIVEKRYGVIFADENISSQCNNIIDRDDELIIFNNMTDFNSVENDIDEKFTLLKLQSPSLKKTFTDYGFVSGNGIHYLYDDLVRGFIINSENKDNVKMALFQIEEHLIASENSSEQTIYFVDKKLSPLIEKYKLAYEVEILFIT